MTNAIDWSKPTLTIIEDAEIMSDGRGMTEQEAFERWASVDGSVMRNIEKRSNGQYQNSNTQHAWRGWKECAALKDAELSREKAGNEAWEAEHIKDMGELNKRIKELELDNERLENWICEGFNKQEQLAAQNDAFRDAIASYANNSKVGLVAKNVLFRNPSLSVKEKAE